MSPSELVRVCMFVRDMSDYAAMNAAYVSVLSHVNPPVRVCVQAPLDEATPVVLEVSYIYINLKHKGCKLQKNMWEKFPK